MELDEKLREVSARTPFCGVTNYLARSTKLKKPGRFSVDGARRFGGKVIPQNGRNAFRPTSIRDRATSSGQSHLVGLCVHLQCQRCRSIRRLQIGHLGP